MRLSRSQWVMVGAVHSVVVLVALAAGLVIFSPMYWQALALPYPITYAYVAQAVLSGSIVLGIVVTRHGLRNPELLLLMVVMLALFMGAMSDLYLRPVFPALFGPRF